MKKSMKFLALFLGFVVLSMFSGCKLWDEVQSAYGPTNKWVSYSWNYDLTVGSTTTPIVLDCYLNYVDKQGGYQITESSGTATLPKGLTVLISVRKDENNADLWANILQLFGSNQTSATSVYQYYTFPEDGDVTLDEPAEGEQSNFKFPMNYSYWVIIYNCIVADSTRVKAETVLTTYTKLTDQDKLRQLAVAYLTQYALTKLATGSSN
ncbi:MAG: hypothetical protein J6X54_04135 [Treponema sp.]|nr:hypothetical protein [Treponema sp.]